MRFLDVTLDTYEDTSGYMYLGLFITIHEDTPRYKITIHVSWTRHDDTSGYNQDTSSCVPEGGIRVSGAGMGS